MEFNLNLKQYINNNNELKALKYNLRNKIKYENNESKNLADIGDYTFDGESLFSEQKIDDDFSDIFTNFIYEFASFIYPFLINICYIYSFGNI